jgi:hypothetical protein
MARFHVTGAVDPSKIGPYIDEKMKILADLKGEGVVEHAYRRSQGPGVFLIVSASNLGDAQQQLGRLPFVAEGLMTLDFIPVNEI